MRMIPMPEWGKKSRIIAALTDGTTRSYDAIAAELGLSVHYVRGTASEYQRKTGTIVRRQKPHRERNLARIDESSVRVAHDAVAFARWRENRAKKGG